MQRDVQVAPREEVVGHPAGTDDSWGGRRRGITTLGRSLWTEGIGEVVDESAGGAAEVGERRVPVGGAVLVLVAVVEGVEDGEERRESVVGGGKSFNVGGVHGGRMTAGCIATQFVRR